MKNIIFCIFLFLTACQKIEVAPILQQNYSLQERLVQGANGSPILWVDNKPIYQKSYVGSGTFYDNTTNIETLVSCFAVFKTGMTWQVYNVINRQSTEIVMMHDSGAFQGLGIKGEYRITIQYTKK